jgi:hypothetical protein
MHDVPLPSVVKRIYARGYKCTSLIDKDDAIRALKEAALSCGYSSAQKRSLRDWYVAYFLSLEDGRPLLSSVPRWFFDASVSYPSDAPSVFLGAFQYWSRIFESPRLMEFLVTHFLVLRHSYPELIPPPFLLTQFDPLLSTHLVELYQ